ncbi:MAG TPA: FixH family protein [Trueperaceae bacterium]|nr:FixH family protein [Trueperaceae bacterium]
MRSPLDVRRLLPTLALVLALLALAACKPGGGAAGASAGGASATGLTAAVEVTDPRVGGGVVTVRVRDGGEAVSGATVEVHGDMTHAGMVPVIASAAEVEPGLYRAEGFGFSMPGDWILTVEVETQDGRSVMTESFLTVAR